MLIKKSGIVANVFNSFIIGIVISTIFLPVSNIYGFHEPNIENKTNPSYTDIYNNILYVGGTGPNNYTRIQNAIDNASSGDIVFVYDDLSPYYENIVINVSIKLLGENKYGTLIEGNGFGSVVEILSPRVILNNFSVQGSGGESRDEAGILVNADYVTVANNIIRDNEHDGISLISSSHCIISDNSISNTRYNGIGLTENSHSNLILNNDIDSGISGIYICTSNQQIIDNNTVSNCSKGFYITECTGNTLTHNHLLSNTEGIFFYYSVQNTIQENNFLLNGRHARFAKFFHIGFLSPNKWNKNYWDDWKGLGGKCIFGTVYLQTANLIGFFIPWIEIDWHPSCELIRY